MSTVTQTLVVTFIGVNPPVREDQPWTAVHISEAARLDGPWTLIDTQQLQPVDPDPSQPAERTITTTKATQQEGFYSLTFVDAEGNASHPQVQVSDNPSAIRPSLSDLGSLMRARTVIAGTGGTEIGTFTPDTRPTNLEAQAIIDQAVDQVITAVGADLPDRAVIQARFLVLLYAAQLVELTFYRNEVNRDQSAYEQYAQLYKDGLAALKAFIEDATPAAPEASFWSVPVLNAQQAKFQAIVQAYDPDTGLFDPEKLPPDAYYPNGWGGIPAWMWTQWPWLYGTLPLDPGLAFMEFE